MRLLGDLLWMVGGLVLTGAALYGLFIAGLYLIAWVTVAGVS